MPEARAPRTTRMRNNQGKLDEFEHFIERIGVLVFGPGGGDFRLLRGLVPLGANLSILIDSTRHLPDKDLLADFQFILDDLRRHVAGEEPGSRPEEPVDACLFNFLPYQDLLARPHTLFDSIEAEHHASLRELTVRTPRLVAGALACTNAYAWLELVSLPDLAIEFDPLTDKRLVLDPDGERTRRGLEIIFHTLAVAPTASLRRYLNRAHYLLSLEYRDQIGRLAAAGA